MKTCTWIILFGGLWPRLFQLFVCFQEGFIFCSQYKDDLKFNPEDWKTSLWWGMWLTMSDSWMNINDSRLVSFIKTLNKFCLLRRYLHPFFKFAITLASGHSYESCFRNRLHNSSTNWHANWESNFLQSSS